MNLNGEIENTNIKDYKKVIDIQEGNKYFCIHATQMQRKFVNSLRNCPKSLLIHKEVRAHDPKK